MSRTDILLAKMKEHYARGQPYGQSLRRSEPHPRRPLLAGTVRHRTSGETYAQAKPLVTFEGDAARTPMPPP